MQAKPIENLFKEIKDLYNEDKLPLQKKTLPEIELMIKTHFLYMRKYFQKPYSTEFNMEKVARFKIRYRYVRARINDLIKEAKFLRDALNGKVVLGKRKFSILKNSYDLEGDVEIEDVLEEIKKEIRYWWILKQKYMAEYTKTSRYKRLQILRKKWQEESAELNHSLIKLKEDYKPYIYTQMPVNTDKWNLNE